jgi:translation initiation factor IF-2
MSEKALRLAKISKELNIGKDSIREFLELKGMEIENNPNAKISQEQYELLQSEFADSKADKEEAAELTIGTKFKEEINAEDIKTANRKKSGQDEQILIKNVALGTQAIEKEREVIKPSVKLKGTKVLGKIDLGEKDSTKEIKEKEPKKVTKISPVEASPEKEKKDTEKKDIEKKEEDKVKASPEPKKKEEVKEVPEEVEKKEEKKSKSPEKGEKTEEKKLVKETPSEEEVKKPKVEAKEEEKPLIKTIQAKADKLKGLKVLGKIELPTKKEKDKKAEQVASSDANLSDAANKKRKRKRIYKEEERKDRGKKKDSGSGKSKGDDVSEKEIQEKIKQTMAKLSGGKGGVNRAKYRREKRDAAAESQAKEMEHAQEESKKIKVTEFVSANDLASMMDVSVNDVISACLALGLFVSINQRLDAETITIIADEFGFDVDFVSTEEEESDELIEEDNEKNLKERAPIVTIMGHVDHGKTSLLDYIRESKITEGESGGITQHIGAYDVLTKTKKRIVFLDTPGHEAFTAMRARGAKVTDIAIIVVAADDGVMPQTKEAINHASVAGVPLVFAINKVDKPGSNPDKIKEELANMNYMVEDWGGKYQCELISAKTGQGVDDLLEKILLEAELLELKADEKKRGHGTVIEASLDKGRGYLATILNEGGTIEIGDSILAGANYGKVKALFDHRGNKLKSIGPATPVQILGLNGAPQAGELYSVVSSEREAREIANKKAQIQREQTIRTKKHITLDEVGRRLAIGGFKELNIIVKGDVDGSVEALADSLLKLSTDEIKINIIHKAVGQISESDVLLASASEAIIIGFQVRPSVAARKLGEDEEIDLRMYSVIYDAINEVKDAMEGLLEPTQEEIIKGNVEIREVFKISKVGSVAGCMVTEGIITRKSSIRVVRDGIVVFDGEVEELKRHKDDVNEVKFGFECGVKVKNFNDIKVGDQIEVYEVKEVKRTLS